MKKLHCTLWSIIVLLFVLSSCSTPSLAEEEGPYLENTVSELEWEVLERVNAYRSSKGLNALVFDPIAHGYASSHTEEMILDGEISHDGFAVRSSKLAEEVDAGHVSENVGKNFATAEGIVWAWIKSPTHKKVMEGDFLFTAVSAKADPDGVLYFTQLFFR